MIVIIAAEDQGATTCVIAPGSQTRAVRDNTVDFRNDLNPVDQDLFIKTQFRGLSHSGDHIPVLLGEIRVIGIRYLLHARIRITDTVVLLCSQLIKGVQFIFQQHSVLPAHLIMRPTETQDIHRTDLKQRPPFVLGHRA